MEESLGLCFVELIWVLESHFIFHKTLLDMVYQKIWKSSLVLEPTLYVFHIIIIIINKRK